MLNEMNHLIVSIALGILFSVNSGAMSGEKAPQNPFIGKENWSLEQWVAKTKSNSKPSEIYFISNAEGTTGPCGCSVSPKGGLDRSAKFVAEENIKEKVVFNTGNAFFSSLLFPERDLKKIKEEAKKIAKAYQSFGVELHNVGELDLALGLDYLNSLAKEYSLPLVSANLQNEKGEPLFKTHQLFTLNGEKVLVTGLSFFNQLESDVIKAANPLESLKKLIILEKNVDRVIVLSDLPPVQNQGLIKASAKPMIILGAKDLGSFERPESEGSVLRWQIQNQGQQWARLSWGGSAGASSWYSAQNASEYAQRWEQLTLDQSRIASLKSSEDQKSELGILAMKFKQLAKFAPLPKYEANLFYEFQIYDMNR